MTMNLLPSVASWKGLVISYHLPPRTEGADEFVALGMG